MLWIWMIFRSTDYFITCYTVLTRPNKVETTVHSCNSWVASMFSRKPSIWSAVNFKNQTLMSFSPESAILVSGSLFMTAVNHNIDVQYQRYTCGKVLLLFHSHVTTKNFEIDGLSNFCKVWGTARTHSVHRSAAIIDDTHDNWTVK